MIAAADADRASAEARRLEAIAASRPLVLIADSPVGATDLDLRQASRANYPHKTRRERAEAVLAAMRMRSKPEQSRQMPTTTLTAEQRDQVRAFVKQRLEADPTLSGEKLRVEANERFGLTINVSNFHVTYWKPVRQQLGLHKRRGGGDAPARKAASHSSIVREKASPESTPDGDAADPAPANRIKEIVDGTDITTPSQNGGHQPAEPAPIRARGTPEVISFTEDALREEVRSLRAAYEGDEHIRLHEQDGVWTLRMYFTFTDPRTAVEAMARASLGISEALRSEAA